MARTSEAMKQAEKDSGRNTGIPPVTPIPEGIDTPFLPPADHEPADKFSVKSALRKLKFPSSKEEEFPWSERGPTVIGGDSEPRADRLEGTVEEYRRMKQKILTLCLRSHSSSCITGRSTFRRESMSDICCVNVAC